MNPSIAPVSEGQRSNFATVLSDAVRKAAGTVVDELSKRGIINSDNFQKVVVERGDVIAATALDAVRLKIVELAENTVGRLKLISGADGGVTIAPTKGKTCIGKAKEIFTGYIDSDFKNWSLNVEGKSTTVTAVQVYEMVKDGTFAQIYGGFGENLDRLCLTQNQIVSFCENNRNWLRTDGYATFFLFKEKMEGVEQFFVAFVSLGSVARSHVIVYRLSNSNVWNAEYRLRFVLPQLDALAT